MLHLSIFKRESFICQNIKSNAYGNLKAIRECVDPAFYSKVIVKHVTIKIA